MHRRHPEVGAADRRGHRPRRVGQRAEEVEDGARCRSRGAAPRRAHARVEDRREEEADARPPARSGRRPRRGRSMTTPSSSSTSAAPEDDDAARLPCLATGTPAAAVTTARHGGDVDRVRAVAAGADDVDAGQRAAPPGWPGRASSRAIPATSSADSPFARSATTNAAICTGVASPVMISRIAHAVSAAVRSSPAQQPVEQARPGRPVAPAAALTDGRRGAARARAAGPRRRRARSAGRPAGAACPRRATSAPASGRAAGR